MKMKYSLFVLAFLSLMFVFGLNACSDGNSTGSEESCNTTLPSEFAPASIDQSYFNSQTEPDPQDNQYSTYFQVQQVATTGSAFFAGGAGPFGLASALLFYAEFANISPSFEDGSCVWEITPPPGQTGGLNLTVTVYATPTNNGVEWEIIYDGEFSEEETVSDFRVLTGFTSNDEQTGEWNYYDPENPNTAALTYTWDIESEDNFELNVTTTDAFAIGSINYIKNGVENTITFDDGENVTMAYWNEDTDSGYYEDSEGRLCYTDFVNSTCS